MQKTTLVRLECPHLPFMFESVYILCNVYWVHRKQKEKMQIWHPISSSFSGRSFHFPFTVLSCTAMHCSDADIARERLRLVLYSDRSELASDVRLGLRQRIIEAISSYVEIESEDDVQLNVSADADLGTVYSITIPVRRVRPEFQGYWSEVGFRDRFYEELLRSQGITEKFTRIELRRDFDREREMEGGV